MMRGVCGVVLLLTLVGCSGARREARLRTAYREYAVVVEQHRKNEFLIDGSPASVAALEGEWRTVEEFVGVYLADHPSAGDAELKGAIESFGVKDKFGINSVGADVVRLSPVLWLVAVNHNEEGTVFLVGKHWGRYRTVWRIRESAPAGVGDKDRRHDWTLEAATEECREATEHFCGPLYATVGVLPPTSKGETRFYVVGNYAQMMGATIGQQTSVWRWDGKAASLLWMKQYEVMADQAHGLEVKGNLFEVWQKTEWKTFSSCGACEGRQVKESLRLDPEGVEDLGMQVEHPVLDTVDELFDRMEKGLDSRAIASAQVIRFLEPKVGQPNFGVGMFSESKEERDGDRMKLCFVADEAGWLDFEAHRSGAGWYFDRVSAPVGRFNGCE